MTIRYFPEDPVYIGHLKGKLTGELTFSLFHPDSLQAGEAVILFSPIWQNAHFVSGERIWKKYLARKYPSVKLITASFESISQSNHLQLLDIPPNITAFIREALTCAEDWSPVDTQGLDIGNLLKQFFQGHGNDSLLGQLVKVHRILKSTHEHLKAGRSYNEISEGLGLEEFLPGFWGTLKRRWEYYFPFIGCLPFYADFAEIDRIIKSINEYFETNCQDVNLFIECDCFGGITRIKFLLDECWHYVD